MQRSSSHWDKDADLANFMAGEACFVEGPQWHGEEWDLDRLRLGTLSQ